MSNKKIKRRTTKRQPNKANTPQSPADKALMVAGNGDSVQFQVQTLELEAPERVYCANLAHFYKEADGYGFLFAYVEKLSQKAATSVTVRYSRDNLLSMKVRNTDFFQKLKTYLSSTTEGLPEDGSSSRELPGTLPSYKAHFELASIERLSYLGGDAEIEFYSLSAGEVLRRKQNITKQDPLIRPILAISLSARLLYELLRDIMNEIERLEASK